MNSRPALFNWIEPLQFVFFSVSGIIADWNSLILTDSFLWILSIGKREPLSFEQGMIRLEFYKDDCLPGLVGCLKEKYKELKLVRDL